MNNANPSEIQSPTLSRDSQTTALHPASPLLMIIALFMVGINLRPALSSIAPLLAPIRNTTGLSSTGAGLLTTLPVLCFGVFAPFAPWMARTFSVERAIFYCLLALAAAIGMRNFFGVPGLFIGTLFVGASIGIIMALLPAIIKRDFSATAGLTTGIYTMALCFGAAAAAGITTPIQELADGDWRPALAFWLLPVLLAAVVWWPQLGHGARLGPQGRYKVSGLYSSALAWQVTAYLGFQSAVAYCVFGWLPTILVDRGLTPLMGGFVLSISIAMQLITSLAGPWLATRGRDQRATIFVMLMLSIIGLLGCVFAPTASIWLWAVLLGLGQGGSFSIAMAVIVLRSPNAQVAASLSGMAQGIGYTIAATGPLAVGILHGYTGDWDAVGVFFVVVTIITIIAAMGAGRNLLVDARVERLN
jgi:CP family cyanate transporter-like MFS transporter